MSQIYLKAEYHGGKWGEGRIMPIMSSIFKDLEAQFENIFGWLLPFLHEGNWGQMNSAVISSPKVWTQARFTWALGTLRKEGECRNVICLSYSAYMNLNVTAGQLSFQLAELCHTGHLTWIREPSWRHTFARLSTFRSRLSSGVSPREGAIAPQLSPSYVTLLPGLFGPWESLKNPEQKKIFLSDFFLILRKKKKRETLWWNHFQYPIQREKIYSQEEH